LAEKTSAVSSAAEKYFVRINLDSISNNIDFIGTQISLDKNIKLGPGLRRNLNDDQTVITESGILKTENGFCWIESARRRYIPVKNDLVLGVVTHKHPEYYRVDINAPELATLSAMAFESATKRNRVTVNPGDIGE